MITSSSSCLLDTAKIVLQVGRKSTRHPSRRSPVDVSFTGYNGWSYLVFLNFKRLPDLQEQGLFVHYGSSGGGGWELARRLLTMHVQAVALDETLAIGLENQKQKQIKRSGRGDPSGILTPQILLGQR